MRRLVPTSTLVVPFGSSRSLAELIRDPPFDVGGAAHGCQGRAHPHPHENGLV